MRARNLRPNFDSLDVRLVLSDSTSVLVGGSIAAPAMLSQTQGSASGVQGVIDWYLAGTPPVDSFDPTQGAVVSELIMPAP